ncbi:monovalent cation/H+ antiporter complex subunit F [Streptomyces sp. UC4497]
MNGWLACAAALLGIGAPLVLWGVVTGSTDRRILAQNAGGTVVALALLLMAQGYARPSYVDLSLVLALLGPAGTLVCVRLLADDLAPGAPRGSTVVTCVCVAVSVAVTVAVCAAATPGRSTVKTAVIGVLVAAGNVVASRSLSVGVVDEADADE